MSTFKTVLNRSDKEGANRFWVATLIRNSEIQERGYMSREKSKLSRRMIFCNFFKIA
jgi:hypothetical protein